MQGVMGESMSKPFDLVLRRKTNEIFAAFWPNSDDPGAEPLNKATKHVASTTLKEPRVGELEADRRRGSGGGPCAQGRGRPRASGARQREPDPDAARAWLIDEFRLWTFPLVLGTGKRLFDGGTVPAGLELTSSQASSTGVIIATYRSGPEIKYGSFAE
jgi:RibD C-terminal domain